MPHAMTNDIRILIDRFFDGETTREEERALYDAFRRGAVPDDVRMYSEMFLALGAVQRQATPMPQGRRPRRAAILRWTAGIAASIAVGVGIGFVVRIDLPQPQAMSPSEPIPQSEEMLPSNPIPQRIALAPKPENPAAPALPTASSPSVSAPPPSAITNPAAVGSLSPSPSTSNASSPPIAPSVAPQTRAAQSAAIETAKANLLQAEQMYLAAIALREQEEEAREREEQEQSYARKLNSLAKEQSESIISL